MPKPATIEAAKKIGNSIGLDSFLRQKVKIAIGAPASASTSKIDDDKAVILNMLPPGQFIEF